MKWLNPKVATMYIEINTSFKDHFHFRNFVSDLTQFFGWPWATIPFSSVFKAKNWLQSFFPLKFIIFYICQYLLGILLKYAVWMKKIRRYWFILRAGIIVMMNGLHLTVNVWGHTDGNTFFRTLKKKRFDKPNLFWSTKLKKGIHCTSAVDYWLFLVNA